jgi:hypothetical protein
VTEKKVLDLKARKWKGADNTDVTYPTLNVVTLIEQIRTRLVGK